MIGNARFLTLAAEDFFHFSAGHARQAGIIIHPMRLLQRGFAGVQDGDVDIAHAQRQRGGYAGRPRADDQHVFAHTFLHGINVTEIL